MKPSTSAAKKRAAFANWVTLSSILFCFLSHADLTNLTN